MSRCCSQCGTNGHNSRTCAAESSAVGEIMLFGVRVKVDPMRKSVSMNNLSEYEQPNESSNAEVLAVVASAGYASADDAVPNQSSVSRERKRGVPWTEEEHKLFLLGLQKVGKGDWRGISRNFVKTRTPTQVASHAQKYFLRRNNLNRRRRRSSLFDITTASVTTIPMEGDQVHQDNTSQPLLPPNPLPQPLETSNISGFQVPPSFPVTVGPVLLPMQIENPTEYLTLGQVDQVNIVSTNLVRPIPNKSTIGDLNMNQKMSFDPSTLSLKLSLSSDHNQTTRRTAFQTMSSLSNGDSIISVA